MAHFGKRDVSYSALDNELTPPLAALTVTTNAVPTFITMDHEHEDANNVIIHKVPKNKGKQVKRMVAPLWSLFIVSCSILRHKGFGSNYYTRVACVCKAI